MSKDMGASASAETGSRASTEPCSTVSALTGFDPARNVAFAISSSACFCPEDDDPENFDGRMVTWTFAAPKSTRTGAGIYKLEFVRILTSDERGNTTAQLEALDAIATEAQRAETPQDGSVHEGAGPQDIAQGGAA